MLTAELNEKLTHIGPGTSMGGLLRRYWHPVAAVGELDAQPVKRVTLLGESLVLYRDRRGQLGLLAEMCMHRGASLAYGIPEGAGLRCAYHGWLYDAQGQCTEQPAEPPSSTLKDQIRTVAYPAQALGGLIFAYLGQAPAPPLPRYNVLVWPHAIRETQGSVISANWLQVLENVLDPMHVQFLHGRFFSYVLERKGDGSVEEFRRRYMPEPLRRIAWDRFEGGIIERRLVRNEREQNWGTGSTLFFPVTVMTGSSRIASLNYIVPLDDTHTWFLLHMAERPGVLLPPQRAIRFEEVPGVDERGQFRLDMANGQDHMATVSQGAITQRDLEHLGVSDTGIILYRELLVEQIERTEQGKEPLNRTPTAREMIDFPPGVEPGKKRPHGRRAPNYPAATPAYAGRATARPGKASANGLQVGERREVVLR